LGM
jgi:hypothetical protein